MAHVDELAAVLNLDELKSSVWRELGLSLEDEQSAREQFAARLLKTTIHHNWTDDDYQTKLGIAADDLKRLRLGNLATFSLSRLIDCLLKCNINTNLIIPRTDAVVRGRFSLVIEGTKE